MARFEALCARERCPFAIVGEATAEERLVVTDRLLGAPAIDIPMDVIFGKPPRMSRNARHAAGTLPSLDLEALDLREAMRRNRRMRRRTC